MRKEEWIWMPHAGHLVVGHDCQFHLATYVGGYLVSTVGEYWPERAVRAIHAEIHDPEWHKSHNHLLGDTYDHEYRKRFGFEEIGVDRQFETMVFRAVEGKTCCEWIQADGDNLDFEGYNTAKDAREGHMRMCEKWAIENPDLVARGKTQEG